MTGILAGLLVAAPSAVVLAHGAWWTVLHALAIPRPAPPGPRVASVPVAVIVPAHDEAEMIRACIESLHAQDYPGPLEILVIADNCSDDTAEIAREAGATVVERNEPGKRGKHYALDFAIAHLRDRATPPAVVAVLDADSRASVGFVSRVAARVEGGARVVQVFYRTAGGATALARLRGLAFALVHWSRPLGLARLGVGTTLKGNGMAFAWDTARDGIAASGIAEDAAFSLALARRGIRVEFEPAAAVEGFVASAYQSAMTQDLRWEGGRAGLVRAALSGGVLRLANGDWRNALVLLDLASLPLTLIISLGAAGAVAAVLLREAPLLPLVALGSVGISTSVGLLAARVRPMDLLALAALPRFVLHKARVYAAVMTRRTPRTWIRTARGHDA